MDVILIINFGTYFFPTITEKRNGLIGISQLLDNFC